MCHHSNFQKLVSKTISESLTIFFNITNMTLNLHASSIQNEWPCRNGPISLQNLELPIRPMRRIWFLPILLQLNGTNCDRRWLSNFKAHKVRPAWAEWPQRPYSYRHSRDKKSGRGSEDGVYHGIPIYTVYTPKIVFEYRTLYFQTNPLGASGSREGVWPEVSWLKPGCSQCSLDCKTCVLWFWANYHDLTTISP